MLYYAEEVDNTEKSVIDLNTKFDNITNEFKMVSDELGETREELTHLRRKNVEIKTELTEMEIFTNNITQYSRRGSLKLHEIPTSIGDHDLGEKVAHILSLARISIKQEEYHRFRKNRN